MRRVAFDQFLPMRVLLSFILLLRPYLCLQILIYASKHAPQEKTPRCERHVRQPTLTWMAIPSRQPSQPGFFSEPHFFRLFFSQSQLFHSPLSSSAHLINSVQCRILPLLSISRAHSRCLGTRTSPTWLSAP